MNNKVANLIESVNRYAFQDLSKLVSNAPSLKGTLALPKSVVVNAVRACGDKSYQSITGCCPPTFPYPGAKE